MKDLQTDDPTMAKKESIIAGQELTSEEAEVIQNAVVKSRLEENKDALPLSVIEKDPLDKSASISTKSNINLSGTYVGHSTSFNLYLRIDIDGFRPLNKVSGDFYQTDGNTEIYFGSFVVDTITITNDFSTVTIEGVGRFTWNAEGTMIHIVIPRAFRFEQQRAIKLQFFTENNRTGSSYVCFFRSKYFRSIQYEQDWESNVNVFDTYYTGSLPSGGANRNLSVASAFEEAGIELQMSTKTNEIDNFESGIDKKWDNRELHHAMKTHFSQWAEDPQWKVWLFACNEHVKGRHLLGIMFDDKQGKHRQGCATFSAAIIGSSSEQKRWQLFASVHELGHCFNILHSWEKSLARPSSPDRADSLSWMNYPMSFLKGSSEFWNKFDFSFDIIELTHLRHAFRNDIIMGGNNYSIGAALTSKPQSLFVDAIQDNSDLLLILKPTKENFMLGEPVVIEVKLSTNETKGKKVNTYLHPDYGFVELAIRKPSGLIVEYKPIIEHCMMPNIDEIDSEHAVYDSAYIGYSRHGFLFNEIGTYEIRASYRALDGSYIVSNILPIIVYSPESKSDKNVSELLMGDDQGMLFKLMGSPSHFLKEGNDAFDQILLKYKNHPLSVYVEFVKGIEKGQVFKTITKDNKVVVVRAPNRNESIHLLSEVVQRCEKGRGLDNITLNMVMTFLANQEKVLGKMKAARNTLDQMIEYFNKRLKNKAVLEYIENQAKQILET